MKPHFSLRRRPRRAHGGRRVMLYEDVAVPSVRPSLRRPRARPQPVGAVASRVQPAAPFASAAAGAGRPRRTTAQRQPRCRRARARGAEHDVHGPLRRHPGDLGDWRDVPQGDSPFAGRADRARMAAGGIVTALRHRAQPGRLVALLGGALEAAHPPEPRTESPLRVPVAAGTRSYGSSTSWIPSRRAS